MEGNWTVIRMLDTGELLGHRTAINTLDNCHRKGAKILDNGHCQDTGHWVVVRTLESYHAGYLSGHRALLSTLDKCQES